MTRSARRGPWSPEEDGALMQLVRSQGPNNWVRISQQIQQRSPKQCRERYHQNLKPSLKHDPISAQEGELIEQMVAEMGKRWAEIARRLGNRSDNAVKNWWNGSMNRRRRNPTQLNTGFKQVGGRLHPIPFTSGTSTNCLHPRPQFEARYSSVTHDRWSDESVEGSRMYRPSNLQIPSPVHTHTSSISSNSPSLLFDSRMTNQRQASLTETSTYSQTGPSVFRPELPPLRPTTYSTHYTDRRGSLFERPLISPALSEASQSTSLRHAPSLISDNQSTYSISPKTVSSPRPGMPAPIEVGSHTWSDHGRLLPALQLPTPVETCFQRQQHLPLDQMSQKSNSATHLGILKDNRMHVSNLLD